MSTPEDLHSRPEPDPDLMLRSRLRNTTPEFEARFDALRRRLAQESTPAGWRLWPGWEAGSIRKGIYALAAAAACVLAVVLIRHEAKSPPVIEKEFGDLVVLDDTLRDAVPLIDDETIETLLRMPSDHKS